jgi:hypothetical protein
MVRANTSRDSATSKDVVLFSSNYTFVLANDFRIASSSRFYSMMLITSAEILASNASAAISASQTNDLLQQ